MAAHADIARRLYALGATEIYLSKPPAWLRKALTAGAGVPVVVNCKGVGADQVPVLVPLARFEALAARQLIDPSATFGAALAAARAGDKDAYAWLLQLAQNEHSHRLAMRLAHHLRVHVPQVGASRNEAGMKHTTP